MADPERYATLDTLKAQLTIPLTETARNAGLTAALAAASNRVETLTGRVFTLDATASPRLFDPDERIARRRGGAEVFLIDDVGSTTGLLVETGYYTSGTFQTITSYATDRPDAPGSGWPITGLLRSFGWYTGPSSRLRVTARWGWPAVPAEVSLATIILAARLYRRKDSNEGVLGTADWGIMRVSKLDNDVVDLLGPLMLAGFG